MHPSRTHTQCNVCSNIFPCICQMKGAHAGEHVKWKGNRLEISESENYDRSIYFDSSAKNNYSTFRWQMSAKIQLSNTNVCMMCHLIPFVPFEISCVHNGLTTRRIKAAQCKINIGRGSRFGM